MTTTARRKYTSDEIRQALLDAGLKEEVTSIEGYGFTFGKHPASAVEFYESSHRGTEARRFYLTQRTYILSA